MIRYFNSFIITTFLYVCLSTVMLFAFSGQKEISEKKIEKKSISLNHIFLVKKEEIKAPTIKEEKIEPIEKVVEKIVKKERPKEKKKKIEKIVKKRLIKKEEMKIDQKEIKKEPSLPTIEKIVKNDIPIKSDVQVDYKKNFIKDNLHLIKKYIAKNVKHSKRARRLGIQGNVIIEFCLLTNGSISNIKVLSGHKLLVDSTIKAIHKASLFFPRVQKNITIKVPVEYKLI